MAYCNLQNFAEIFILKIPFNLLKRMLRPIFCIDINTHEKFCKIYSKKLFFQKVLAFIHLFYRYHYIRYFIYSDCMWHMCTRYKEGATGDVLQKRCSLLSACNLLKKRFQHRCFPVIIAKFLRTSILKNICGRLLIKWYVRKYY